MLRSLVETGCLYCPACRGIFEGQYRDHPLALGEVFAGAGGRVEHGLLACTHCSSRFPVVDGVALIFKDPALPYERVGEALFEREDLPRGLRQAILKGVGDEQARTWRRQMLAIYSQDLRTEDPEPTLGGRSAGLGAALAAARAESRAFLRERLSLAVSGAGASPLVLDAGCGVGAATLELAGLGARVLALDTELSALRLLSQLLHQGEARVPSWRHGGSDYLDHELKRPDARHADVLPICADALAPPLGAACLDLAVCLNTLDNVEQPVVLLRQLYALLKPGGLLILASPFDFVSRCTPSQHRLGEGISADPSDPDPARALRDLLTGRLPQHAPELNFELGFEEPALPWVLPRHGRSTHVFASNYVEARKPA